MDISPVSTAIEPGPLRASRLPRIPAVALPQRPGAPPLASPAVPSVAFQTRALEPPGPRLPESERAPEPARVPSPSGTPGAYPCPVPPIIAPRFPRGLEDPPSSPSWPVWPVTAMPDIEFPPLEDLPLFRPPPWDPLASSLLNQKPAASGASGDPSPPPSLMMFHVLGAEPEPPPLAG